MLKAIKEGKQNEEI